MRHIIALRHAADCPCRESCSKGHSYLKGIYQRNNTQSKEIHLCVPRAMSCIETGMCSKGIYCTDMLAGANKALVVARQF